MSNVILKIQVGEAVDGGAGSVVVTETVITEERKVYEVFVDGGSLPDGRDSIPFTKRSNALTAAFNLAREIDDELQEG